MSTEIVSTPKFQDLELGEASLQNLAKLGYETPTPIQELTIPHLLEGKDVVGQAQTGTGKTAAFALPLISRIDPSIKTPQVLVLAPTRELAIQVSAAFEKYGSYLKRLTVLPVYGGADINAQIRKLRSGVQVIVGTPGRVMDHLRRKTLKLESLQCMVLDEADEVLNMGFQEDVEWILEHTPAGRQIALFSATMPPAIRKIAKTYLQSPEEITIKQKTTTADTINQRFWRAGSNWKKYEAMVRIIEGEEIDGMLVFVRTKSSTVTIAEKLQEHGVSVAALNGDIVQNQRERIVQRLKSGQVDVVVATDVAARGLDVQRISHVLNYDLPRDVESYIHRVGRTGRAGRKGEAISFVSSNEIRFLKDIERSTKQRMEPLVLPSTEMINKKRVNQFKEKITQCLFAKDIEIYQKIVQEYFEDTEIPMHHIAAALAKMAQGDTSLFVKDISSNSNKKTRDRNDRGERNRGERRGDSRRDSSRRSASPRSGPGNDEGMESYKIQVGHNHGVKPGNIVGAIANEAGLDSGEIGRIKIYEEYSTVDLPGAMSSDVFRMLQTVYVAGQPLNISRAKAGSSRKSRSVNGQKFRPKRRRKERTQNS